jgi:3',5'-cyclic AMP phosphodiesterase CpdA
MRAMSNYALTIFHASDLHVSLDENFLPDKMEQLITLINDTFPDLLIISGDFVVRGTVEEYERARAYVERMRARSYLFVPGNHDLNAADADPLGNYKRYIGEPFSLISKRHILAVGIDSTEVSATGDKWNAKGYLGKEVYAWIDDAFNHAADTDFRIAVVHHHLIAIPGTGNDENGVLDAGDVLETLLRNKVNIVLSGHRHRPYLWNINGMPIVHCGTSTCKRYRGEPVNTYNLIEVGPEIIVTRGELGSHTHEILRMPNPHWA